LLRQLVGYPVAAVITRREIADELAKQSKVFSTFGGNPVAAAAALAVLDVSEDEQFAEHAARIAHPLLCRFGELNLGEVRGRGLLVGVELNKADLARSMVNQVRERGIVIGRTGRANSVLKIRPPLIFQDRHMNMLAERIAD
jgi:4-aminobutyrate aminotransferase-like enzyme